MRKARKEMNECRRRSSRRRDESTVVEESRWTVVPTKINCFQWRGVIAEMSSVLFASEISLRCFFTLNRLTAEVLKVGYLRLIMNGGEYE